MITRRRKRALLFVAILLIATAYVVSSAIARPTFFSGTFFEGFSAGRFGRARPHRENKTYHFQKTGEVWSLLDYSQVPENGCPMCSISIARYSRGWWHPSRETRVIRVDFVDPTVDPTAKTSFDDSTRHDILKALETALPGTVPPGALASYANGGAQFDRILWLGVLGDLSILAAFAAIIFSLVQLRREIKHRVGHCSECGYDLAGIAAGKCPECGAVVGASDS